jgi:hypothetical protein
MEYTYISLAKDIDAIEMVVDTTSTDRNFVRSAYLFRRVQCSYRRSESPIAPCSKRLAIVSLKEKKKK